MTDQENTPHTSRLTIWADDGEADVLPGTPDRPQTNEPFFMVADRMLNRRAMLKGGAAATAAFVVVPSPLNAAPSGGHCHGRGRHGGDPGKRLSFKTVPPGDGTEPDVRVEDKHFNPRFLDPEPPRLILGHRPIPATARQPGFAATREPPPRPHRQQHPTTTAPFGPSPSYTQLNRP